MGDTRIKSVNLLRDLRETISADLQLAGYSKDSVNRLSKDDRALIGAYLGVRRRWIPPGPRQIHKAKCFSCPRQHAAALAHIENTIKSGGDLTPHLSTKILYLKYNDPMMNDWGIHHLHLGTRPETKGKNKGFVKRTGPLLYCYFTESDAYLLDIRDHGAFEDQELVAIMHENWPFLLERFRTKGTKGSQLTDEEVRELRRKRANHFMTMNDGTVYRMIGEGVTTSGENIADVINTDRLLDWLSHAERAVVTFIEGERRQGRRHLYPIELRLCVIEGRYSVEDSRNGDMYLIEDDNIVRTRSRFYKKTNPY